MDFKVFLKCIALYKIKSELYLNLIHKNDTYTREFGNECRIPRNKTNDQIKQIEHKFHVNLNFPTYHTKYL